MPIEFDCPNCGRHYKVADSNAGKRFACKECSEPVTVPSAAPPPAAPQQVAPPVAAPPPAQGGYQDEYAGYDDQEYDQGYDEGAYDQGYDQGYNQGPAQGYGAPQPRLPQPRMPGQRGPGGPGRGPGGPRRPGPRAPMGPGGPRRGAPRPYGGGGRGRNMPIKAHRASNVFIFALLGWFICPIFCIAAIVMGGADLKEMKRGAMDRSGEGLTKAAYWISWFVVGANAIVIVLVMIILLAGAGPGAEDDTQWQRQETQQPERFRPQGDQPPSPYGN